jgi:N-acetylmuramoyl-L-alanine amidase
MGTTYSIKQGDHLSGIAEKFGFRDYETIWNNPQNAALKKKRGNPHVLFPGDQLYIPDNDPKSVFIPTTKVSIFRIPSRPLLLRLALKDFDDRPLSATACVLEVAGVPHNLSTDAQGFLQLNIPKSARSGVLRVPDLELEVPFRIGDLDPPEEDSGWLARLINLGYYAGPAAGTDDEQIRFALEEFQCDHKLKVTGIPDGATRAKLKELHGA